MDPMLTRRATPWGRALPLAAAVLLTAPVSAAADWLVTKEGARVETRGAWQEKGKLVVFTLPDGTLSSMRADLVDLEASRRATEEAKVKAVEPAAPKPRRPSVRSFTDKDFRPAGAAPAAAGAPGETAAPAEGQPAGENAAPAGEAAAPAGEEKPSGLEVVTWERVDEAPDGVRLTGILRNNSPDQATGLELVAGLYDETGALLVRQNASLDAKNLGPGESTSFTVDVPGTFTFSAVRFQMRSTDFKVRVVPVPTS